MSDDENDRAAILARRRHFLAITLSMSGAVLAASASCAPCLNFRDTTLRPGGVFVVHVHDRRSLDRVELERGDLIQRVDERDVATADELELALADGRAHQVTVYRKASESIETVAMQVDALPFWCVGAAQLDPAPSWARRRLWGHASPQLLLVRVEDGQLVGSLDLVGRRWLVALVDWASAEDRQHAALTMQVMQKAQSDLHDARVEMIFAQIPHPQARGVAPMTDADLREFFADSQLIEAEGGPLPPPPLHRTPNNTEFVKRRARGMEGERTYDEFLAEAPNILVLDERGIIRWHSGGATPDPTGEIAVDMVYTVNEAVWFALREL